MSLIDDAARFAVEAHAGMRRKGGGTPYVLHPFEVASIVATMTSDEEVLAAALLHDTVEDAGADPDDLRARFGERVAELVASETENKHPELPKAQTWHLRKEESLERLAAATDEGVRMLWLGDKLSNMRAIARDYALQGDRLWNLFHVKERSEHEWHYRGLAASLSALSDTFAYQEFVNLINQVFHG